LWIAKNGLKLNTSKTKCMLLHSARREVDGSLNLQVDGMKIEQVRVFKYLGVQVNDTHRGIIVGLREWGL
jgi:hypothetical protein